MKRILEQGELTTDMECAFKALRNVGGFVPIPFPLIGQDDPRLSDSRLMLDGSVNNSSVAEDAGIQQGKLNLNGNLPLHWLLSAADEIVTVGALPGPDEPVTHDGKNVTVGLADMSLYAVPGDDAEYIARKGAINGYVPLDATGRMPVAHYPTGVNAGTVSSFGLSISQMMTVPGVVTQGAATMVTNWPVVPEISNPNWFGNNSGVVELPRFNSDPFHPSMIPNLDASKIISDEPVTVAELPSEIVTGDDGETVIAGLQIFDRARIPIASGVGAGHAPGIVPDPGLNTPLAADYLARDMTYKTMTDDIPYQTRVPNPAISYVPTMPIENVLVTITSPLAGTSLFYRLTDDGPFSPYTASFTIPRPATIEAYGAKVGYNNSNRVFLIIPPP